ncbi:MAG: hypothetical protein WB729_16375 [Candidatus Sulfotelmatobacter sp.]
MTRINVANRNSETRNSEVRQSVSWGRTVRNNAGPLVFAAVLIVCSLAVGCSSEKPQPLSSNNPAPVVPVATMVASNSALAPLPAAKPAPKKVVHKRPATVTYADKTYGISFVYPRRYAIETGDATKEVLMSSPLPMNFVQPGGVALAAVELPETGFANTDFSSAFFDVSVNNTLTADQCGEFSVPQSKVAPTPPTADTNAKQSDSAPAKVDTQSPKLMLGDLEMHGAEAVSGEGTSQSDSKYFHVFQNGVCYEFALNVTTNAAQADASLKHIDRDKVFARLETILATAKIENVEQAAAKTAAPEKTEAANTDAGKDAKKVDVSAGNDSGNDVSAGADTKPAAPTTDSAPVAQAAPATSSAPPQ